MANQWLTGGQDHGGWRGSKPWLAGWLLARSRWTQLFSTSRFITVSSNHNVVLKVRETVVDGFDKMPQALMGLFTGDNTGKMVVKA